MSTRLLPGRVGVEVVGEEGGDVELARELLVGERVGHLLLGRDDLVRDRDRLPISRFFSAWRVMSSLSPVSSAQTLAQSSLVRSRPPVPAPGHPGQEVLQRLVGGGLSRRPGRPDRNSQPVHLGLLAHHRAPALTSWWSCATSSTATSRWPDEPARPLGPACRFYLDVVVTRSLLSLARCQVELRHQSSSLGRGPTCSQALCTDIQVGNCCVFHPQNHQKRHSFLSQLPKLTHMLNGLFFRRQHPKKVSRPPALSLFRHALKHEDVFYFIAVFRLIIVFETQSITLAPCLDSWRMALGN